VVLWECCVADFMEQFAVYITYLNDMNNDGVCAPPWYMRICMPEIYSAALRQTRLTTFSGGPISKAAEEARIQARAYQQSQTKVPDRA